ncbi:hypothetical protein [Sunxiuqinia rutila]|uniref:hypothetical protein n=1 Tax=Sunxiuqinia rutila TaxID=1397841 RepID=UPI003D36FE84
MILDFLNKTFNNREIALIFYLFLFILWNLTQKKIRESIFCVIGALFVKQIFISILCLLIYITIVVCGLSLLGLWNSSLIKDTIYWSFGVGFILMMDSNKALQEKHYFKKFLLENIKVFMIIEFILGLYVFGIITEFILMPIVIFLSISLAYTEVYEEHKQVRNFLLKIFGAIAIFYIIYSGFKIYQNFKDLANYDNLRALIFPAIMTILFLPFAYFYVLYSHYESLFIRVGFFLKDNKSLRRFAKWRILFSVNFSLKKLKLITPGYLFGGCETKEDVKHEIVKRLNKNPAANIL